MKKFLVVIMALVMCFTTITTAFAADVNNATIDKNKTCSLTINKYAYEVKEINAIEGVEFTILNVAEIVTFKDNNVVQLLYGFDKESSAELLSAINLANGEGRYTQADNINASKYYYQQSIVSKAMADALLDNELKVKNALESYISKNTNAQKMPLTNEKGKSVETGLNVGLYLVVETRVPENVIDTTNPFFVSLPMTVNGDTWNYDVVVYPKNETGNPTLEKEVKESQSSTGKTSEYGSYATASAGDIVEYKIQSTLPVVKSNATFLTEYCFVDTLSEGISYIENEIVFEIYSDAACNSKVADWTEEKNLFTVTYENNVMKINISQKGLAEINNKYSEHTILIKYSAKVNSDESLILGESGNSNKVKLTWRRTSENYYDTLEDKAIVYSFGINITKHFSDKTDKEAYESGLYDKVEFKVYNETDKVWLVAENIDGIYYVKGYTTDESKATSFVPVNFSEEELGKLCVYGVEDDVYQIVEVNTAEGYTLLEENVELSIVFENENASAFVAGKEVEMNAKNESADATVSLNIVNNKVPDLPITGDTGMFMFVAIGVVLMTGAVIAIKKISRKNKD